MISGRVGANRELGNTEIEDLDFVKQDGGCFRAGEFECRRPGHRGYVVRVVPGTRSSGAQRVGPGYLGRLSLAA